MSLSADTRLLTALLLSAIALVFFMPGLVDCLKGDRA